MASKALIDGTTRKTIAQTPIVLIVKKGAPKPAISSLEEFIRTLRNAKAIAFNNPATGGPVGVFASALIERLGLAEELKPKLRLASNGVGAVNAMVSDGTAEIGFTQTSELVLMPDVELAGRLPKAIHHATIFVGAIVMSGADPTGGNALINFFAGPDAQAAFREIGME